MAHSCTDQTKCVLKYTTLFFLLIALLALRRQKYVLAASCAAICVTSIAKYWQHPPRPWIDVVDMATVNILTLFNMFYQPFNMITATAFVYNVTLFAFFSRNDCVAHSTIHIATCIACIPWIYHDAAAMVVEA
jgi:hypothetical protein